MNVKTDTVLMVNRDKVKVACARCGWSNDGKLVLVDRYLTDWPPGPRGDGAGFLELYLDDGMDPDDRVNECPECGHDLYPDDVVEPNRHDHLKDLSDLCDLADLSRRVHHRLRVMISQASEADADLMSAENWMRMALPMIEGAQHDLTKYIEKEKTHG